jgi:hypothetical protein
MTLRRRRHKLYDAPCTHGAQGAAMTLPALVLVHGAGSLRIPGAQSRSLGASNVVSRDGFQISSRLIDLVIGVGHHLGIGHTLAGAVEQFVGLVAEGGG